MSKNCKDIDLSTIRLSHGSHGSEFRGEACLVECANLLATCDVDLRERFGKPDVFGDDHPSISRVVRSFAIALNDRWLDDNGNPRGWWCPADAEALLRPYAARVLGSRTTDADEEIRRYLCIDWAARTAAPMWLDAAGQTEDAATLRALPAIVNEKSHTAVRTLLGKIKDRYYEARRCGEAVRRAGEHEMGWEFSWLTQAAVAAAVAAEVAVAAAEAAEVAVAAAEAAEVAAMAAVAAVAVAAVAAVAEPAARLRPTVEQVARSALSLLDQLILVGYENRRPAWRIEPPSRGH